MSAGGAWHLGEAKGDRRQLRDTLLAIYDLRSRAAHRGKFPSTVKDGTVNRVTPHELVIRGQDICRRAILKVIENGMLPETDELILGT